VTTYEKTFERPVLAERILLALPANVVTAARIRGNVDARALETVLDRLRARHALLAVRVAFAGDGGAAYRPDGVPPLPLRILPRESDDAWLRVVEEESRTAFPLEEGPLARAVLLHSAEGSDLVLCAQHAVTDGRSMIYLLRDILHHLAHPDEEVEPLPEPPLITPETVPHPPRFGLVFRGLTHLLNWGWKKKGLRFGAADRERLHEVFWEKNAGARALAGSLSEPETASLVARCREEKVTVNSALWAAFLAAQNEVQGDAEAFRPRAGMAVSTRDRLKVPVGEALGFFASSLTVHLPFDPRVPFWDAARDVQARIRAELAATDLFRMLTGDLLHPTLLDALYFRKYGLIDASMPMKMLKKMNWEDVSYGYSITNVGRMEIPTEYGPFELETVHGPYFYSDVNEKVVGVTTVGGRLTFLMAYDDAKVHVVEAGEIRDLATRLLNEA
jgi:hypothetical protein